MGKKHRSSENARPPKPRLPPAAWVQKHSTLVFVGLLALASLRIAATYSVFNHTADEPGHIAVGMQWLDQGLYTYESQHPPLARIAVAFGPFLMGRRTTNQANRDKEGIDILYGDGHYERNLTLSRLAILPFFWIACFVLYAGAKARLGEPVALVAVFLFSFLPPVLAHAGLATTDMPLTAMLAASFVTGLMWLERPSTRRSVLFGGCTGLAVLSKLSSPSLFSCPWRLLPRCSAIWLPPGPRGALFWTSSGGGSCLCFSPSPSRFWSSGQVTDSPSARWSSPV